MEFKNQLEAIASEHFDNMKSEIQEEMAANIVDSGWYMASSLEQAETAFVKLMNNVIDWTEGEDNRPLAWIRPDILENKLAVPIGEVYYGLKEPLPYRWVDSNGNEHADADVFQVLHCGSWVEAQSIDWNFTDNLTEGENK